MKKFIVFGFIAFLCFASCVAVPAFAMRDGNSTAIGIEAGLPAPGESVIAVPLGEKEGITQLGCVTQPVAGLHFYSSHLSSFTPGRTRGTIPTGYVEYGTRPAGVFIRSSERRSR